MSLLTQLQEAAGVTEIVWIDDLFAAAPPADQLRAYVSASVRRLHSQGLRPRHASLRKIDPAAPENVRNTELDRILDESADIMPRMLDCLIKQEKELPSGLPPTGNPDLNPAQVVAMLGSLSGVTTFSLAKWSESAAARISTATRTTLFLVDREFVNEEMGADAGDDVVRALVPAAPESLCIMLTHTVAHDATDELRTIVAGRTKVPAHRFAVMSKRDLGQMSDDVDPYFARALKTTMLHRFCADVAGTVVAEMTEAGRIAIDDLSRLSVEEVDTAIFENSIAEGASELDVIARIVGLKQRVAAQKKMAGDAIGYHDRLARIRAVRHVDVGDTVAPTDLGMVSVLHDWRHAEVFDEGEWINPVNSPLACGDVFLDTADNKKYVLLVQPCDVTVRGRGADCGKRRRDDGILVNLSTGDRDEKPRESIFRITGMETGDRPWLIDFQSAVTVDLRVLDLAVMNSGGMVEWTEHQPMPSALLPGWRARFEQRVAEATGGAAPTIRPLSLSCSGETWKCDTTTGSSRYPLRRIGRIRSPYAEAILGSYAAFVSRAAFDHDFAKGLHEPTRPVQGAAAANGAVAIAPVVLNTTQTGNVVPPQEAQGGRA